MKQSTEAFIKKMAELNEAPAVNQAQSLSEQMAEAIDSRIDKVISEMMSKYQSELAKVSDPIPGAETEVESPEAPAKEDADSTD